MKCQLFLVWPLSSVPSGYKLDNSFRWWGIVLRMFTCHSQKFGCLSQESCQQLSVARKSAARLLPFGWKVLIFLWWFFYSGNDTANEDLLSQLNDFPPGIYASSNIFNDTWNFLIIYRLPVLFWYTYNIFKLLVTMVTLTSINARNHPLITSQVGWI